MTDVDAALEGQVFDILQRQREAQVQHHHHLDHLGRAVKVAEWFFIRRSSARRRPPAIWADRPDCRAQASEFILQVAEGSPVVRSGFVSGGVALANPPT